MKAPTTLLLLGVGAVGLMTFWQFGSASGAPGDTVYKARSITTFVDGSAGYIAAWTYMGLGYQTVPTSSAAQSLTLARQMIDAGQG